MQISSQCGVQAPAGMRIPLRHRRFYAQNTRQRCFIPPAGTRWPSVMDFDAQRPSKSINYSCLDNGMSAPKADPHFREFINGKLSQGEATAAFHYVKST